MLLVVSARKTTSGLGGITGVVRVLSIVRLPPGAKVPIPAVSGSSAAELLPTKIGSLSLPNRCSRRCRTLPHHRQWPSPPQIEFTVTRLREGFKGGLPDFG
jgi:hypothetical protein